MAILTAGNDAIDMREPDWGLTAVGDASAFLDAFDPVRTEVIEETATSFTYNSYDSRNNLVILKGTGNIPLGSLNSLTVEVPLYSVRLTYSGSMNIDPWGNVSGSITGISAYLTSDNRLLGQMTGINVPWDSSDLDSLTNPVILGGSDTLPVPPRQIISWVSAATTCSKEWVETITWKAGAGEIRLMVVQGQTSWREGMVTTCIGSTIQATS